MGNCTLLKLKGNDVFDGMRGILGSRTVFPIDGPCKISAWTTFGKSLVTMQRVPLVTWGIQGAQDNNGDANLKA